MMPAEVFAETAAFPADPAIESEVPHAPGHLHAITNRLLFGCMHSLIGYYWMQVRTHLAVLEALEQEVVFSA